MMKSRKSLLGLAAVLAMTFVATGAMTTKAAAWETPGTIAQDVLDREVDSPAAMTTLPAANQDSQDRAAGSIAQDVLDREGSAESAFASMNYPDQNPTSPRLGSNPQPQM